MRAPPLLFLRGPRSRGIGPKQTLLTDVVTDVGSAENPYNQASSGFSMALQFNMLLEESLMSAAGA